MTLLIYGVAQTLRCGYVFCDDCGSFTPAVVTNAHSRVRKVLKWPAHFKIIIIYSE